MTDVKPARFLDGLANVITGAGTSADPATYSHWSYGGLGGVGGAVDYQQIDAAYRTNWMVRKAHDIIPEDMVKNWRKFSLEAKLTDKITAEEKRLKMKAAILKAERLARLCGGAAIIMGLPGAVNTPAPPPTSIGPGALRYLFPVSRLQLSVGEYVRDLDDPLFNQPAYFNLGAVATNAFAPIIHPSRVITFHGLPGSGFYGLTSDNEYWGYPLMESINSALIDAASVTRSIAQLMNDAKTDVLSIPGLTDLVSTADGEAALAKRVQTAQLMKSMLRTLIIDGGAGGEGDGETWEQRQLQLSDVTDVGRFFIQIVAGAVDTPMTKFIGSPPEGMNATGEHDERNYDALVNARQENRMRPGIERIDPYMLASAGVKEPNAKFDFNPLHQNTPEEQGDLDNKTADTYALLKESGLIPYEALSKTLIAVLDSSPNFPGLGEAVEENPGELPAVKEANKPVDMPTNGATRIVNQARAKTPTRLRVVGKDELMHDARPRTLYISRKVLNPQEVLGHYRRQDGVKREDLIAAGDLHVSVITSQDPVDWMTLPASWDRGDGRMTVAPGGARATERLGSYVVLEFMSEELKWRVESLVGAGVTPRWPDFKPHVSIFKDPTREIDDETLKPYTGRIVLGPEIFEEVLEDLPPVAEIVAI